MHVVFVLRVQACAGHPSTKQPTHSLPLLSHAPSPTPGPCLSVYSLQAKRVVVGRMATDCQSVDFGLRQLRWVPAVLWLLER